VLALDADAAGRDAAIRGHDVVREALKEGGAAVPVVTWRGLAGYQQAVDVELKVAVLPEGRDPDDVIRASPEDWGTLIDSAVPVLDFRLEALAAAHDLSSPAGRSQLAQEFLPVLGVVTDPVLRAHYLQRLGRLAATGERELNAMLVPARRRKGGPPTGQEPVSTDVGPRGDAREEFLLALLLRYPALREDGLETPDELFWSSENRALLAAWKGIRTEEDPSEQIEAVKEAVPLELTPYVERLFLRKMPSFDRKEARKALSDCIQRLERRRLEAEKQVTGSLLAEREAEVGASVLAEAASEETVGDKRLLEIVSLQIQDMKTGLRLHRREIDGGIDALETGNHG